MKAKTFHLIKTRTGLHPADDEAAEALKLVEFGDFIKCTTQGIRNVKFLRKFMKLVRLGYQNQERFTDFTTFRYWLMIKSGHYKLYDEATIPDSVSFERMDESQFKEVYNDVHTFLCSWLDVEPERMNEIIEMM